MEQDSIANDGQLKKIQGMYQDWFLDYASYVILERAIPEIRDGLKPVQRRILHSMREMEDGRYNKVANIVGNTMKYHPHGDAAITDALVQLGQKDLLIDTQGNWGNTLTGDSAAASRYIEARLTKFALEVAFYPKTTQWHASYDGRNKEPVNLPMKFPLLLAQGVEGIAVGLSTKVLPHNFNELIDASINHLKGKGFTLYPDFDTGGSIEVKDYNDGERGGRVRVRAKISKIDKNTLAIQEIPYGTNTGSLIESIVKANEKGKIKIKKIEDNTAGEVEILVHLIPGVSPDKSIDALYAFTDCEISLAPNACVIVENQPRFLNVSHILIANTEYTVSLLQQELEIELIELQEKWHFANLERIFIEKRIYRDIEEEETWNGVLKAIDQGLKPHISHLVREIIEEDLARLTEIKIKRISRFDLDKAAEDIAILETKIAEVKHKLDNLISYAIEYYTNLKTKYGKGRERKTEIKPFDEIDAVKVAAANVRFYINRTEGFIGTSLKKDEFLFECSDLDDIIVFLRDGTMIVTKVDQKTFVGKDIIYAAVWEKKDNRTIYNYIYRDGLVGATYMKRFDVTSITRDKSYNLTNGKERSEVLYFSANPNGEAEIVEVFLKPRHRLKKIRFEIDFSNLDIKSRSAKGNLITKNAVRKIALKEEGISTLAPRKIWFDDAIGRLNIEGRGQFLGHFKANDKILCVNQRGEAKLMTYELSNHFDEDIILIEKWNPGKPLTCIYYDANKHKYYIKRFLLEDTAAPQVFYSKENEESFLEMVITQEEAVIELVWIDEKNKTPQKEEVVIDSFIEVKGIKAKGNQLSYKKLKEINLISFLNKDIRETSGEVENIDEDIDVPPPPIEGQQGNLF